MLFGSPVELAEPPSGLWDAPGESVSSLLLHPTACAAATEMRTRPESDSPMRALIMRVSAAPSPGLHRNRLSA